MKNVFIILINRNGCEDTKSCIESIHLSSHQNYVVLVVDNDSEDNSVSIIKNDFPEVIVIESDENIGFAGGCNLGIRYALDHGADYVWLLNNDTLVEANTLSNMLAVAKSDQQIGAVGAILLYMDQPDKVQARGGGWVDMWRGMSWHCKNAQDETRLTYLTGASMLIRHEAIIDIGLLDASFFMYWEDADYSRRLSKAGWKLKVASNAKILHKESATTGRKSTNFYKMFNHSSALFFRKHSTGPLIPVLLGGANRILRRLLRFEFANALAVYQGIRSGLYFVWPDEN